MTFPDDVNPPDPAAEGDHPPPPGVEIEQLRSLPKEVGVLLLIVGLGGILLPGPVGTPFVLASGVVLWPSLFDRAERAFMRRFPALHRIGVRQIGRYLDDLERRYPSRNR